MNNGPLVYYKLTLWAFSSGELIILKYLDMQVQANSEEPDRLSEQSDQGLHYLPFHLHLVKPHRLNVRDK